MDETELRQAMAGLLDQEPSDGVDARGALDAGRSALRARRTRVAVSCALAALVVAVAVPLAASTARSRADVAPAGPRPPSTVVDDGRDGSRWCTTVSGDCVDIGGWIVYQSGSGLWALDPSRSDDPGHQIQLTDQPGVDPLEWSRDGTELLVRSQDGRLTVLHADGTETMVVPGQAVHASLSPDGSTVAFTPYRDGGMALVDSRGGTPRRLLGASGDSVYAPAFSPDGRQIAYFTGGGDHSHSLRVMGVDGTGDRTVWFHECCHIRDLDWSPDGRRLMIAVGENGIWTVGVDGSDPARVVPSGVDPAWSPDGRRISFGGYPAGVPLRIADADGSQVVEFAFGGSGAWNPLPPPG